MLVTGFGKCMAKFLDKLKNLKEHSILLKENLMVSDSKSYNDEYSLYKYEFDNFKLFSYIFKISIL